jgi:crotonobetainyl-CoA:carnitine CoA-transferase CaiB-like acyl-CoA transferase
MTALKPLTGLTVVAIEQAVAAPFATCRLADAGADVIKIERPEGDFARGYDDVAAGQSSYFVWLNRGKKSVALDLTCDAGQARLRDLISGADVVVQNLRHGAMERLGLSVEELRCENPALITCSITGFDPDGDMATRKAYDLLIQAESGLCSITGGPDEPARVGVSVVDIATGATAHAAILEALIARGITGQGVHMSISMFDVMADWLTVPLLNHEGGRSPKRGGLSHPSIAPYGVFETQDAKQVLISVQSDREWAKLCELFLGDLSLSQDPRFANNVNRVENRVMTDTIVADAFLKRRSDQVLADLAKADVAFALLNDMAGLSAHPELQRMSVTTPNGPVSYPAPAPRFNGQLRPFGPVPELDDGC